MYKKQIEDFESFNIQEETDKKVILEYIDLIGDGILDRSSKLAHLTSSGFIMNKELTKTLMIHHNIYDAWGWTGGHVDGDRDMLEVAIKEAIEETGISRIAPLTVDMITLDIIPVPAHIKRGEYVNVHLHLNASYVLIASEDEVLTIKEDENSGVKWIPLEDLEKEVNEPKMIPIYKKIIEKARDYKKNISSRKKS